MKNSQNRNRPIWCSAWYLEEKVNKEVKEKWVEALRSGSYQKGFGYLSGTQKESFCYLVEDQL